MKELTELHGGRVDVRSTPGRGSTFTVWLPFGTAHYAAADDVRTSRSAGFDHHLSKPPDLARLEQVLAGCRT